VRERERENMPALVAFHLLSFYSMRGRGSLWDGFTHTQVGLPPESILSGLSSQTHPVCFTNLLGTSHPIKLIDKINHHTGETCEEGIGKFCTVLSIFL
jgi:hypothetical protein